MIIPNKNKKVAVSILSEFTRDELEELILENSSLRGYLQGYLAEAALKKQIKLIPEITSIVKIPDQNPEKGDFKVEYKGVPLTIEVKSVQSNSVRDDILNDTWQGTVGIKNTDKRNIKIEGADVISSSSLERGQFDILAVSCYAVSNTWNFLFIENDYLPSKSNSPGLLKTSFTLNPETTPCVTHNLISILDSAILKKQNKSVKI